jgi:histidine triad (HIT) family protein
MGTIFEKIISREIGADILYEDDEIIAIKDINPKAKVHILIITKKVIGSLQEMEDKDFYLLGKIVKVAKRLSKEYGIEDGYRLITNNGKKAGQSVFHLHFHLLGGSVFREEL